MPVVHDVPAMYLACPAAELTLVKARPDSSDPATLQLREPTTDNFLQRTAHIRYTCYGHNST